MLVKVDRMSMANSLEIRCPMLDHQLAELAARIPPVWKIRNGKGKRILIEALGDRRPPELLNRPKQGGPPGPLSPGVHVQLTVAPSDSAGVNVLRAVARVDGGPRGSRGVSRHPAPAE